MSKDPMTQHSARMLQALDFAQESADQTERHRQEMSTLFLALLEVMDSLDRLRDPPDGESPAAAPAVTASTLRLVAGQLEKVLAEAGVTPEACLGQPGAPTRHEIVEARLTDAADDDVVIAVSRRGWRWDGQPLRRSQVVVAQSALEEEKS